MAANTRNDLSASGILQEYLSRRFLERFDPNLQFLQLADRQAMNDGYNTLRWARFTPFAESAITTGTTSTDGVTPSDTTIAITPVTATATQYRIVASLSDMLLATNPLPLLQQTADELGVVMAKKIDTDIQAVLAAGTNVIYGTGNSARTDIASTEVITLAELNRAAAKLASNDVPPVDGVNYVAVMHPAVVYDLRASTATGSWLDINKYDSANTIMRGEIGSVFGVRVVTSSHITTFSSTATVYPTYVFGRGAFGAAFVQEPQVMITPAGPTDSDPAAQRRKVSAKAAFGAVILNQNAVVRIETAATTL